MKMQYTDSSEAAPIWALAIFTYAFFGVVALSKVLPSHLVLTPGVGKAVWQAGVGAMCFFLLHISSD